MNLQRLTNYLLTHRFQTIALTFILSFIPVFWVIGTLITIVVTLRKGILEGAVLTLVSILAFALSLTLSYRNASLAEMAWMVSSVGVVSYVITWILAVMLRRQMTWSNILQVTSLFGVLVVSVLHLIYPDIANWWGEQLLASYQEIIKINAAAGAKEPVLSPAEINTVVGTSKLYANGFIVAVVLLGAWSQLALARWWELFAFREGKLRYELHNIRLSQLAGVLFIISIIFSYLGNSVIFDIMPILYVLFGVAGLSLIHYFFGLMHSPTTFFWLGIFYLTLVLMFLSSPSTLVLLPMLALFDVWFDIRKRVKKSF
jgi:hypothetical protein